MCGILPIIYTCLLLLNIDYYLTKIPLYCSHPINSPDDRALICQTPLKDSWSNCMEALTDALAIEKVVTRHLTEMIGSCDRDWHVSTSRSARGTTASLPELVLPAA